MPKPSQHTSIRTGTALNTVSASSTQVDSVSVARFTHRPWTAITGMLPEHVIIESVLPSGSKVRANDDELRFLSREMRVIPIAAMMSHCYDLMRVQDVSLLS